MSREVPISAYTSVSTPRVAERGDLQAAVVAAYDGKRSNVEIGAIVGRNANDVGNVLRRLHLPIVSKRADEDRRAEYRACAEAGMTIYECAEKLGISPNAVNSMAKCIGIKFTPKKPGRPQSAKQPKPSSSAVFSASPDAIRRYLERAAK